MTIGLSDIINGCAVNAGMSIDEAESIRERLLKNEALLNEFVYYIKHRDFLCEYKIEELSIADVMVYQIDYFKAAMDQDRLDMKFNPDKMLLSAFKCMLDMADDRKKAKKMKADIFDVSGTDGRESETSR